MQTTHWWTPLSKLSSTSRSNDSSLELKHTFSLFKAWGWAELSDLHNHEPSQQKLLITNDQDQNNTKPQARAGWANWVSAPERLVQISVEQKLWKNNPGPHAPPKSTRGQTAGTVIQPALDPNSSLLRDGASAGFASVEILSMNTLVRSLRAMSQKTEMIWHKSSRLE